MHSAEGRLSRARLLTGICFVSIAAPLSAQPVASTDPSSNYLRDRVRVASIACELASSTRPKEIRTRCRVLGFRETAREFIVRLREIPVAGAIEYPLSEIRLSKDRRGAVLSRSPDL